MFGGILPESVSTFGGEIDSVFRLILYVVGFFFIVAEVLLVYFAIRYRRGRSPRAVYGRGEIRIQRISIKRVVAPVEPAPEPAPVIAAPALSGTESSNLERSRV